MNIIVKFNSVEEFTAELDQWVKIFERTRPKRSLLKEHGPDWKKVGDGILEQYAQQKPV